jgi:hypothetical protein
MTMRNVGIVFSLTLGIPTGVFSPMSAESNRAFDVNDDAYKASAAIISPLVILILPFIALHFVLL